MPTCRAPFCPAARGTRSSSRSWRARSSSTVREPTRFRETVHGVIMARLDRLPDDPKRLLQTASIIGREVPLRVLTRVWNASSDIGAHLDHLCRHEFLYERAAGDEPAYVFKHALTQDVAYDSLLARSRRELHLTTARALEELYADRLDDSGGHARVPLRAHRSRARGGDLADARRGSGRARLRQCGGDSAPRSGGPPASAPAGESGSRPRPRERGAAPRAFAVLPRPIQGQHRRAAAA